MEKLKINSKEARLIIWLMSEGFYTPLNEFSQNNNFAQNISDALTLQKKAISYLKNSLESNHADGLIFATNIISVIALIFFHSSSLMNQSRFWGNHNKEEIERSIDRFAKQNYHKNIQLFDDFKTICSFSMLVETYLVSREDLTSNYYHNKEKPNEYLFASGLDYLVPIKPAEYSDIVLAYFELFLGGYKSSIRQHTQIHKTLNAFCCPFDEEHVLVSKDVAQALMATTRSKEINAKWGALIEGLNASNYISLIDSIKRKYLKDLNAVFPMKEYLLTTVAERGSISIPGSILNGINSGYQLAFHQALDGNSSLIELTTIDTIIEQFLDMVLFDYKLSIFFKKVEYAQIAADMTLPSFCNVKPDNTVYLMPEGVRIGIVEKREHHTYVQEYKEFIQDQ